MVKDRTLSLAEPARILRSLVWSGDCTSCAVLRPMRNRKLTRVRKMTPGLCGRRSSGIYPCSMVTLYLINRVKIMGPIDWMVPRTVPALKYVQGFLRFSSFLHPHWNDPPLSLHPWGIRSTSPILDLMSIIIKASPGYDSFSVLYIHSINYPTT